ncbi:MAG: hypothetical protein JSU00_22410 [Acidobacteria bacterium]|nr:hypothetical protein [Acidobacteriota bacterium]
MNYEPFHFHTERRLVELTGRTARTLAELRAAVGEISGACIFYHTHHLFLSHHFETPLVYNDFADWTGEALQEGALSEKLAAIDLMSFTSIRDLREAIMATIDEHLASSRGRPRECPPGDEFYFCKSKSFIMATGVVALDVADFFRKLAGVTNLSLYFHFLEARLRLERRTNDFSHWMRGRGETALADDIDSLDPYIVTLDELKQQILESGRAHGFA